MLHKWRIVDKGGSNSENVLLCLIMTRDLNRSYWSLFFTLPNASDILNVLWGLWRWCFRDKFLLLEFWISHGKIVCIYKLLRGQFFSCEIIRIGIFDFVHWRRIGIIWFFLNRTCQWVCFCNLILSLLNFSFQLLLLFSQILFLFCLLS